MSKSTRKPYSGYGHRSRGTKNDRAIGHRIFRHASKVDLNTCADFEDFVPVHSYQFVATDPWRVGCNKSLSIPGGAVWSKHCLVAQGFGSLWDKPQVWPPTWYIKSLRK